MILIIFLKVQRPKTVVCHRQPTNNRWIRGVGHLDLSVCPLAYEPGPSVRSYVWPVNLLPIESLAKRLEHTLPNTHTVVSGRPYPLVGRSVHFVVINYNWATRVVLLFAGIQAYPLPHYNRRIRNEVIILLDASQTQGWWSLVTWKSDCEGVHSVVPRVVYNIMTTLLLFLCFGLVSVVLRDTIQTVEMSIGN